MQQLSDSFHYYVCDSDIDEDDLRDIRDNYGVLSLSDFDYEVEVLDLENLAFSASGIFSFPNQGRCKKQINCKYRQLCKYLHTEKEKKFFENFKNQTCKHGGQCKYRLKCKFYHTPQEIQIFRNQERDIFLKSKGIIPFCENKIKTGECKQAGRNCIYLHSEEELKEFFYKLNSKFQFDAACSFETNTTAKSCTICFIDYQKGVWLKKLRCKHCFHLECIKEWYKTKRECPVCKANYNKDEA